MNELEEYVRLKETVERLDHEEARLQGEQDAVLRKLKELGCNSLEKAKAALKKLEAEEKEADAKFQQELSRFNKRWGDKLNA